MSIPRQCPHCEKGVPVFSGYAFDKELNLVCGSCGKVIFPVTAAAEAELKQKAGNQRGAE